LPVIHDAKVDLLRVRLGKAVGGSGVTGFDFIVVELTDDAGRTGWGFSYVLGGGGEVPLLAARLLLDRFVVGKPLEHPLPLWRSISQSFNRTGRGAHQIALAAIDVAAWDLYASRLALPLGVAMGGLPRAVPVYGSGGFMAFQDPDDAAATAREWCRRGARGVKVRVTGDPRDTMLVDSVAEALSPGTALMVDANERCTLAGAQRLLRDCAAAGALFVEEPLPTSQLAGYRTLAQGAPVAIATGEHCQGCGEAAPLVMNNLCGVFQPDLAMMGGLTECLRVAQMAEHANIEVSPHFLPGLFVHLAAAAPNITWLEDFPLVEVVLAGLPEMNESGTMEPSMSPGHGLTLASGAYDEFRVKA
jgi:L-alanine-DL-glutamate epimerase-like enolase superfamily enzyme